MPLSRRTFLAAAAASGAGVVIGTLPGGRLAWAAAGPSYPTTAGYGAPPGSRGPDSLPHPDLPPGTVDESLPFDHVVIVMQENHSFDNYFGMLPLRGQPLADGFTFDADGTPTNANPVDGGLQAAFRLEGTCQPNGVDQTWDATHFQVDGGAMDGFAKTDTEAMGYWDEPDIPFYYSLAKTFCLGNRYFCSVQGQTYPNRRMLYSGTADGTISSSSSGFELPPPANGTLMDKMSENGVTWMDYFSDLPVVGIIPSTIEDHPANFAPISDFFTAAATGTLPDVCFVDAEIGVTSDIGDPLQSYLQSLPGLSGPLLAAAQLEQSQGGDEENPQDVAIGEAFTASVVDAVMSGPGWARTLMIWIYDEHGGYYDHVVPPAAIVPDDVAPMITASDYQDGYDVYGIRIPNVVVSPYSRPNAVTDTVHDHTSVIATIAAKWNLPALTWRDANAAPLWDYVDFESEPAFLTPPTLAAPAQPAAATGTCRTTPQPVVLEGDETPPAATPESPLAVALPVAAAAVAGGVLVARHRRDEG